MWGRRVLGAAAVAMGAVTLASGEFLTPWHAAPDWLPARGALVYVAAAILLLGGLALQFRRSAPAAGAALGVLSLAFAAGWTGRFGAAPPIAIWLGVCEQVAIAVGAFAAAMLLAPPPGVWAGRSLLLARVTFGLCQLVFGLAHLLLLKETAAMTPAWLPPGQNAWAVLTGVAHIAGGLGLILGIWAALAARLLTAMFLGFGLFVWVPIAAGDPRALIGWAGNAANLALVGAIWALADLLTASERERAEPLAAVAAPA